MLPCFLDGCGCEVIHRHRVQYAPAVTTTLAVLPCCGPMCTVAMRQENMLWFKAPPKIYFKRGSLDLGLGELKGQ